MGSSFVVVGSILVLVGSIVLVVGSSFVVGSKLACMVVGSMALDSMDRGHSSSWTASLQQRKLQLMKQIFS